MIDATYYDLVRHVLDMQSQMPEAQQRRYARQAVQNAQRDVLGAYEWNCLRSVGRFTSNGAYSTGTVDYTAATRELVLTGGTWPEWAAYGSVWLGRLLCDVSSRNSDTSLTLAYGGAPTGDLSDYAYNLIRESYPLPCGVLRMDGFTSLSNFTYPAFMELAEWTRTRAYGSYMGIAQWFTFDGSDAFLQKSSIRISPPPSQDETFEYTYLRKPRDLRVEGEYSGTITGTNSSTTVAGTGTAFSALHVGCVLRLGSNNTDIPTASWGDTPGIEDRIVTSVSTNLSLTVDAPFSTGFSNVKYLITDPLDINPDVMLSAMQAMSLWKYAVMANQERRGELRQAADRAMMEARGADALWVGTSGDWNRGYVWKPIYAASSWTVP